MVTAWRRGDIDKLGAVLLAEERKLPGEMAREFHNSFLTERNVAMASKIERMLNDGQRVFVAVGAMHMVGTDGLPTLLAQKGFEVKRLR